MGVFKPLLPVGDQPAVVRCVNIANAAGIRTVIVVTGNMRGEIEHVFNTGARDVRLVHNSGYRDGMFSSACAGVSALPSDLDGFFLLPADCCAISPDTLTLLMKHYADSNGSYVTRPRYKGRRGHPPLIPARFISPLLSYNGENGLKGFLSPLPTLEIEMETIGSLLDMDTPDDYATLLDYLGLPACPTPAGCAELFSKYGTPPDIVEHGTSVSELALKIARLMGAHGENLDLVLLESACLLHDICRAEADHARAGMGLLLREGYPKAAMLVGCHMDLPDFAQVIGEAQLLYLSDKLFRRGKLVMPEETLRELESRFSEDPSALASAKKRINTAQAILTALSAQCGIEWKDLIAL